MKTEQIEEMIRAADTGPRPPGALVEQMASRCTAIERGRAAEAELAGLARQQASPGGDAAALAARILTGQIAAMMPIPAAPERIERQLLENPKFRRLAEQPVDKLLSDVHDGRMLKALAKAEPRNRNRAERDPAAGTEKGGIVGP